MREAGPRGEFPHAPDVVLGEFLDPGVGAQRLDLPADVDHGLVERVAERVRGVAAHQDGPGLGHEPAHVSDVPGHRDRAALERDPGPGRRVALDHDQPAARRRPRALGGVPRHEVLPHRPADEAVDHDVRAVAEAADEVPGVARDRDVEPGGQADGQVVPPPRLDDADRCIVRQLAQRLVQLAHREPGAAELDRRHSAHV